MKEITSDVAFLTLHKEAQWNCKRELQRENWKLPSLKSAQILFKQHEQQFDAQTQFLF